MPYPRTLEPVQEVELDQEMESLVEELFAGANEVIVVDFEVAPTVAPRRSAAAEPATAYNGG